MVIRMMGGLGNQMFQYAVYKALSKQEKKVTIDTSYYNSSDETFKLDIFQNISYTACLPFVSKILSKKYLRKIFKILQLYYEERLDDCSVFNTRKRIIEGYFQDEKYFLDVQNELRKDFCFPKGELKLIDLADKISKMEDSVSLHVRRGDYLKLDYLYGGICTEEYYKKAIEYLGNDKTYVIFSNDIEWVIENIKLEKVIYINNAMFDKYEDWYDMYLMSICKYNIIANSSFSWWGAWLNQNPQKIVIAPKRWINTNEDLNICPLKWIRM